MMPTIMPAVLFTQDGRYGLEEDTKDDIFTVADSSLNASAMIGACANVPVVVVELIVHLRTSQPYSIEPITDIKSFYGIDG